MTMGPDTFDDAVRELTPPDGAPASRGVTTTSWSPTGFGRSRWTARPRACGGRAGTAVLAGLILAAALSGVAKADTAASAAAGSSTPACGPDHWVGSWTASPGDGGFSRALLANQTLRMIIAPHLGGRRLRIHLSNRFGSSPVTLGPVTVGLKGDGPSLIAGSQRPVRFTGSATITIASGADVVSDPVELTFSPFEDLAISVAIPGSVTKPTEHYFTRQTSYLTPAGTGDHAADTSGAAFTQTTESNHNSTGWYFLDEVDVEAGDRIGAVAAFGDSTTDGFQGDLLPFNEQLATIDANTRWPDFLQRRLIAAHIPLSVLNTALDGNRILQDGFLPPFGPSGISRFRIDALGPAGISDVIVLEGINDIGMAPPGGITAQQIIDGYRNLIEQAHRARLEIQLGTLTPAGGVVIPTYGDAQADQLRRQVNAWIRGQRLSDGVSDFDAAVRDPSDPSRIYPPYDSSDHLHFNAAGYQAMADAVQLGQLRAPQCGGRT
jgi:lysophospholipase L1-like esterase